MYKKYFIIFIYFIYTKIGMDLNTESKSEYTDIKLNTKQKWKINSYDVIYDKTDLDWATLKLRNIQCSGWYEIWLCVDWKKGMISYKVGLSGNQEIMENDRIN